MLNEVFKIIKIDKREVTVETKEKEIKVITAKLPKFAVVGDFIRQGEHSFYDVVDKYGEMILRQ